MQSDISEDIAWGEERARTRRRENSEPPSWRRPKLRRLDCVHSGSYEVLAYIGGSLAISTPRYLLEHQEKERQISHTRVHCTILIRREMEIEENETDGSAHKINISFRHWWPSQV